MTYEFRALEGQDSRDLRIEDFLGSHSPCATDGRIDHWKQALGAIHVQVPVEHIVGCGCEHGNEPPVPKHQVARVVHDETCLKVERGKVRIRFVDVPGQIDALVGGHARDGLVLWPVRIYAAFLPPSLDRFALRIAGEEVLGEHNEIERRADKHLAGGNPTRDALEGRAPIFALASSGSRHLFTAPQEICSATAE